MSTLTATYDSTLSRVRLAATGLSVTDAFGRTVSSGFGTATSGQVWVIENGSASDYSVGSGKASISHAAVNVLHIAALGVDLADVEVYGEFSVPAIATGGSVVFGLLARHTDADNHYRTEILFRTDGTIDPSVWVRVGGVSTSLASATNVTGYTAGGTVKVRFQVVGTTLRARAWTATEPTTWQVEATDNTFASGKVGVRSTLSTANTNTLPLAVTVDNFSAVPTVNVQRSMNGITWATVRGGGSLVPDSGAISIDDYEFAPDVRNFYRVAGAPGYGPALNPNQGFEVDAAGWVGSNATIARSTVQAKVGVASVFVTPDGVSTSGGVNAAARVPVVAGEQYLASMWVFATQTMQLGPAVDWQTQVVGGSFVGNGFVGPVTVAAGVWTLLSGVLVAPATAGGATIRGRHAGTPTAAQTWYADEIQLQPLGITPVLGGVWLKSVGRPFLNRQVVVQDYSDVSRPSRTGVFEVVGRSFPVSVNDVRGSRRWTLDVLTSTATERQDVDLLLASGDTLLVHVPADVDVPGGYVTVGDITERRTQRTSARRIFSLPCTEVATPTADVVGITATWQSILNNFATWADVLAAFPTWSDVLEYVADPQDVIIP